MCGLIGYISANKKSTSEDAKQYVVNQYEEQHDRGTKGFGIVSINDDGTVVVDRATEPVKMMVDLYMNKARHVLLHHRFPTSTDNRMDQTHPIAVSHAELAYDWLVMHNGVISNHADVKRTHDTLGYEYTTLHTVNYTTGSSSYQKYNDSETFAIELVRLLEGKSEIIATRGNQAFMAVATKDGKVVKIVIGTNGGYPLGLDTHENGFAFASEELYGPDMAKETAVTFTPKFVKGALSGFVKGEPFALAFAAYVPVQSTYYPGRDDERYGYRPAGFRHEALPPAKPPVDVPQGSGSVLFSDFAHIVRFFEKGPLGDFFREKASLEADAVLYFPWKEIKALLDAGRIIEAEGAWNDYLEDLGNTLDLGDVLSQAVGYAVTLKSDLSTADALKVMAGSVNTRMGIVAKELVPLFKMVAFMDMVLRVCYKQESLIGQAVAGTTEEPVVDTPESDEQAQIVLQILEDVADTMRPEAIYGEVESVADTILAQAGAEIMDQLQEMRAMAAENGESLGLSFFENKIKEVGTEAGNMYARLAKVVKKAQEKEAVEESLEY